MDFVEKHENNLGKDKKKPGDVNEILTTRQKKTTKKRTGFLLE